MAAMPFFAVNKETIAFAAGIIGLLTVGWQVTSYFKGLEPENNPLVQQIQIKNIEQDDRLDRGDRYRERDIEATKESTAEMKNLNTAITRLTTVMEQNGLMTKKAQVEPPILTGPSRYPITYEVR